MLRSAPAWGRASRSMGHGRGLIRAIAPPARHRYNPAMPYASLRDFMARLEREGRLVRVREPVSPVLEMTEIQTRLLAEGGPAVLFENVVGPMGRCDMPVLVN